MKVDRRCFCLGLGALALAPGCEQRPEPLLPDAEPPAELTLTAFGQGESQVVEVRWAAAVDRRGQVAPAAVHAMLQQALERLCDSAQPFACFAGASRRLSIKVNAINCQAHTHPELADALAQGLLAAGATAERITVWDRDSAGLSARGYQLTGSAAAGYRCLGGDAAAAGGYPTTLTVGGNSVYLSRLVSEADLLFSIAALKDHSLAGVSLSLKNNFGVILGADRLHGNTRRGSGCEPGISELAAHPELRGRLQLAVIDALVGVCEGGPGTVEPEHAFRYGGLLVSRDPVALDRQGRAIIERRRAQLGLIPLDQRRDPPAPSFHIEHAAALGVGG